MLYPVMLDVEGADVLVVGAGRVGASKAAGLAGCGARVTVVAPFVSDEARRHATAVHERPFEPGDVAGRRLVVTATGVREVDSAVFTAATAAGIWVNSADDPERCTFILPSVLRRGPVIVSVSTSGASPALAKHLRDRIGELVGPEVEAAAADLAARRAAIKSAGGSTEDHDWSGDLADALRAAGGPDLAGRARALEALQTVRDAGFRAALVGGWSDEMLGLEPPRLHSDVDLLVTDVDVGALDRWLSSLDEITAKRQPHKRAFRLGATMVELHLVERRLT